MDGSAPRPPVGSATKPEQIREAAMKCFAENGVAGTSLQMIADAADVSIGLIQYYFVTKGQLIESIDRHVLTVFRDALGVSPGTDDVASASEVGSRFAELMHYNPAIMDYVGRALAEGGEVGRAIFDGLYAISEQQGVAFAAQGLTPDDLDSVWAAMLPLIIRVGTIVLRPHVERRLAGSLYDWDETSRWDAAVLRLIQKGQFKQQ
ncbi:TetR/AcrR family transcriptional regulator [Mycolicibacterium fluoranthenivorans]|jgi:AcrR family transcriptional regulator|uniref:Transcriptional regulator, TetR family n=1 Tax=Mycolicibacterium fluoranthenivorans TaxID=258505 RepID=A0A1G4VSH8_9MYCO|nr:helix-turn-helix domain-containing protein [Mycolicibacterium fluoranthenivorans]SCX11175.1 transcriptional regulator, TetR family [Mycolicibacterium fluoranthenivorans]